MRAVLIGHTKQIASCYAQGLLGNGNLAGSTKTKFVVGRDGAVAMTADGGSSLADTRVSSCITNTIGTFTFPASSAMSTVVYELKLSPP